MREPVVQQMIRQLIAGNEAVHVALGILSHVRRLKAVLVITGTAPSQARGRKSEAGSCHPLVAVLLGVLAVGDGLEARLNRLAPEFAPNPPHKPAPPPPRREGLMR